MKRRTVAEQEYEYFAKLKESGKINPEFLGYMHYKLKEMIKYQIDLVKQGRTIMDIGMDQDFFRQIVRMVLPTEKDALSFLCLLEDDKAFAFFKWMDSLTDEDYYLFIVQDDVGYFLVKRNIQMYMVLNYCRPNETMRRFTEHERVIELSNIASFKKGEGYMAIQKILIFSQFHDIPIVLWSETEKNVKYFEQYGFKNKGQLGDFGEYLMVYEM